MYVNYSVGGDVRLGFLSGTELLRLDGGPTDGLVATGFPAVPSDATVEDESHSFLPALLRPGKILCLLRSFRAHAEELGNEPPPEPLFFAKLPSALIGHGEPIVIPEDLEGEVHHEGELALVIGRSGRRIPPERGMEHVAALTVANDVTARTRQKSDAAQGWPWTRGKSIDTFLPLGPGLVPVDSVADPGRLDIDVQVNGQARQSGSTRQLLWPIGEIVARLSRWIRLDPGDVILTGTPPGVGPIVPGDEVSVRISEIGRLVNPVGQEAL